MDNTKETNIDVLEALARKLEGSRDYKAIWAENIAMEYKNSYSWWKNKIGDRVMNDEDINIIANNAAAHFLNRICNGTKYSKIG